MKFSVLFMPVIFSAAAQLLVKAAASYEIKTTNWLIFIGLSLVSYMMAFGLYSFTVRNFPITIASPINTIAVMIIVFLLAALLFGEVITAQKVLGVVFGLIAIILLLPANIYSH